MSCASLSIRMHSRRQPLDVAELRAHCAERVAAGEAAQTVEALLDLCESLCQRMDQLELRLGRMMQAQWGRKSERLSSAQLCLLLGEAAPVALLEESPPPAPVQRAPKRRPPQKKTRQIRAHIPRKTILSEPEEAQKVCGECGASKQLCGTEPSEVLEWEPGGFVVEVTQRRKYACRTCQSGVVIGPGPARVIEQAMPGAGLLAEVVVRKVKDPCPLERQSRIFTERFGVPLSASTLGEWMAGAAEVLCPVAKRLKERALLSPHLSFDDTPLRVLDPAHPQGVKRGHLWSFLSLDESVCFYQYTPTWHGEPIKDLLSDYKGTLQSDGYKGVDGLYQKESGPKRAGCLAHARRKFVEALQAGDLRAALPLQRMQQLYQVERQAREQGLSAAELLVRRQQVSAQLMKQLRQLLDALGAQAPPKTPLGRAITYALRQWETLEVYLMDGEQAIDNNHTERMLRPVAVGRKNWLFAGSDEGARRLAVLYTVVGSAELAGIRDPWRYLRDVLCRISRGFPQSRLDQLLPKHWLSSQTTP